MTLSITMKRQFRRGKLQRGSRCKEDLPSAGPLPRISRLMALAIRLDRSVHDRIVNDQAELASLGHVSRARLTQIFNLLNLAPEIQAEILGLQQSGMSQAQISERQLRPLTATVGWGEQRSLWRNMKNTAIGGRCGDCAHVSAVVL
jgi:hypothetical protein